jgi:hypothetical protein
MGSSLEPRQLLETLLSDAPVSELPAELVQRARAFARDVEGASAEGVKDLPEPLALAVLEASVRARSTRLPEALAAIAPKPLAKAAKKALHRLHSAGVEVAKPKPVIASPPTPGANATDALPYLVSPLTGTGERALILPRAQRGGVELHQIVLSDEAGILQWTTGEVGRSAYRRQTRELLHARPVSVVEISLDEARVLLAEAAAVHTRAATPLPPGAAEGLRHLSVPSLSGEADLPTPTDEDVRLATEGGSLHDEPEIVSWLPSEAELRALALKLDEIAVSALYIDATQRAQQAMHQTAQFAQTSFTPEVKRRYARRLWAMADYFEKSGRARKGEIARAEARRLFHDAPGLFSPFALRLFEKVVELTRRIREGEALPDPRAAAPEPTSAPEERRTPGGLILP